MDEIRALALHAVAFFACDILIIQDQFFITRLNSVQNPSIAVPTHQSKASMRDHSLS